MANEQEMQVGKVVQVIGESLILLSMMIRNFLPSITQSM